MRRSGRSCPTLPEIIFFFVAGAIFCFAAFGGYLEASGLRHGRLATGTIVERDDGGKVPTVVLRFTVPNQGEVDCITDLFSEDSRAGEATPVRYDPEDPEGNCSTGERGGYGGFLAGVVVALGLLANGERLRRRRERMLAEAEAP